MQALLMQCIIFSVSAIQHAFCFKDIWHYFSSIGSNHNQQKSNNMQAL